MAQDNLQKTDNLDTYIRDLGQDEFLRDSKNAIIYVCVDICYHIFIYLLKGPRINMGWSPYNTVKLDTDSPWFPLAQGGN